MKDVVIASAGRTAIGAFGATLKDNHAATIASVTMKVAATHRLWGSLRYRQSLISLSAAESSWLILS